MYGKSMRGCTFWDLGQNTWASIVTPAVDTTYVEAEANGNSLKNPYLVGLSRDMRKPFLDPRPCDTSSVLTDSVFSPVGLWQSWFQPAAFRGAFYKASYRPGLWIRGWTAVDEKEILVRRVYTRPRDEWTLASKTQFTFRTDDLFLGSELHAAYSIDKGVTWHDTSSLLGSGFSHAYSSCGCRVGRSREFWTHWFPSPAGGGSEIWFQSEIPGVSSGVADTLRDQVRLIVH